MKVLLVAPFGGVTGGIARWTEHILDYYKKTGRNDCDLDLLSTGRSTFVNINSSVCFRIISALKDYRIILKNFRSRLNTNTYDVMHLTSSASLSLAKDLYMLHTAKRKGIKTIIHFHFGRIPELAKQNNWEWKLLCKVIQKATKAIVIDQQSYNSLVAHGFNNIALLPNPIAPEVIDIVNKNNHIERDSRNILFVGHCVKTKGVEELVTACKQIPNITLRMIGTIQENMRMNLEAIAENGKWLELKGEMPYEQVIREMQTCDIFVLPTYTEGFPNVILESMACGCAIVTTPVGAIPQMLEDDKNGKYGVLVEPRNVQQLHDAIEHLLNDEHLKQEMRQNVQCRVNERYNIDVIWNKMLQIWEESSEK